MPRKLKYACDMGGVHHGLCSIALEEAGLTKKYLLTEGFRRTITLENDGFRAGTGETWTELVSQDSALTIKTFTNDCVTRWMFTYPALQLYAYQIHKCSCGRKEQADFDL